jgi:hypothetical protein
MNYFRFEIPTNADGSRATYSPGWHGTMQNCPKNVKVLLYNDKEGYGIAQTEDKIVQPEIKEVTREEVDKVISENVGQLLADTKDIQLAEELLPEGLEFATSVSIAHKWDRPPEVQSVDPTGKTEMPKEQVMIPGEKWYWCNECQRAYLVRYSLPSRINALNVNLTVACPVGHKGTISIKSSTLTEEVK